MLYLENLILEMEQKVFVPFFIKLYFPVDPGVTNRPIRFKLTTRTDDPKILRTTLQIHWSSPVVNK